MTTMCLYIETLPQLASAYRSHVGEGWRDEMPPQEACDPDTWPDDPEPKKVPRNWKDPAKIAQRQHEIAIEHGEAMMQWRDDCRKAAWDHWRSWSLDPHRGQVHTICAAVAGWEEFETSGDAERGHLICLLDHMRTCRVTRLVTWGEFDQTFLWGRAMRLDLPEIAGLVAEPHYSATAKLKLYGRKVTVINAMDLWPHRKRIGPSLQEACEALGIDHGEDNPMPGSEVLDRYLDHREADIVAHCRADVRDLAAVWGRLAAVWGL